MADSKIKGGSVGFREFANAAECVAYFSTDTGKADKTTIAYVQSVGIFINVNGDGNPVCYAQTDQMHFKGGIEGHDALQTGSYTPAASKGDWYIVTRDGYINSTQVYRGDILKCTSTVLAASANPVEGVSVSAAVANQSWDYIQSSGERALLSAVTLVDGSTATTQSATDNSTKVATTAFVQALYADVAGGVNYKGTLAATAEGINTPVGNKGDMYKVSSAGYINGTKVEIGDMVICHETTETEGDASKWDIIQGNVANAVSSNSTSSTNTDLVMFDGTSGNQVKDSGISKTNVNNTINAVDVSGKDNTKLGFISGIEMGTSTSGTHSVIVDDNSVFRTHGLVLVYFLANGFEDGNYIEFVNQTGETSFGSYNVIGSTDTTGASGLPTINKYDSCLFFVTSTPSGSNKGTLTLIANIRQLELMQTQLKWQ